MRRPLAAAVSLAVLLLGGAVAVGVPLVPPSAAQSAGASAAAGAAPASGSVDAAPRDDSGDDLPNEADIAFAAMMIPHHQQAIDLSRILAATPGIDETSTALAAYIERDQAAEIAQMQSWSDAWHEIGIMDHGHTGTMSGMATAEQIAAFDGQEGAPAEKAFLALMIAHHEGAIQMARRAIADGDNSFIRALSKHIAAEQQREIEAMTARLGLL
ncbi:MULTISPECIES: DUF305 domain-containing protein [unclassified Microbacterium]|uniref:DUF305 domain-containing protein n=1 Tax=unclassified Microbacterium TaxID=2609290 RepID=UPI00214B6E94|nr:MULTISPECIES: DUF305 domain-containing protein [unclassified Microbacterium]MCR2784982.1 DUF305 domain-containing protein [Microbacterium sp. zg.B96]WIM16521.1 DUF305 domain-containing protein [Microbacterium sp. zg-B96]